MMFVTQSNTGVNALRAERSNYSLKPGHLTYGKIFTEVLNASNTRLTQPTTRASASMPVGVAHSPFFGFAAQQPREVPSSLR